MLVLRHRVLRILLATVIALTLLSGCGASLEPTPGTVGGSIDSLERAIAEHDWDGFRSLWDLEAVGTMYEQESVEVADALWMDTIEQLEVTEAELVKREYYPEDVALTRESMDQALESAVASGFPNAERGIMQLIRLDTVVRASVKKDTARVTFRIEGHIPEELVLEFWRVEDGSEVKWIVSRISNAKDIAKQRAAF